ncbi:glycoside hydrolase family 3 protein [Goodfellowiella coeruleoviolacea]|uniref:glycoside hydrolase family 3 protein n=1 Tax=Goodfellowiella coeruleoviolacea TaxID=334858 RepID=UPI0020A41C05|nr:glycoside hydrolase family 3 protein [Goodfellowiella coeruleoviolacea]
MAALVGLALIAPPAAAEGAAGYPFRDPALPLAARVSDLIGRLTTAEKVSLLHQYQPAIPRLGIGAFRTGTEALHGVAWLGPATVFPQAVGLGSTWDPDLLKQVGAVVGREARGYHVQNPGYNGLNLWAPVVNLLRDPRWGRNEEGYAEDPLLTGALATAYGHGIQGDDPRYLQAAPTLKHYLAYNNEVRRDTTSSSVPPRILHDYDEVPFRAAISADAATGVMPSYNLVNGRPNHVNPDLNQALRSWTEQDLLVVSDAGAPENLVKSEHYYDTQAEANAAAIKAGLDSFTVNDQNSAPTVEAVTSALDQGLLTVADIDRAVRHILSIRFRLGEFDPAGHNPYAAITPDVINAPEHQKLARRAAAEQVVLLRNDRDTLPLSAATDRRVAVVGPLADTLYEDWYSGTMPYRVTPVQGIRERLGAGGTVTASEGVDRIALKEAGTGRYVTASSAAGGAALTVSGTESGPQQAMDVFDWGQDTVTLRTVANGKFLSLGDGKTVVNNAAQPTGWFVQQQFSLVRQADGSYLLGYAGNDAFNHGFAVVGADGRLTIGATTPEAATRFTLETVSSGVASAVAAARGADAAVVVVGSMPFINGREDDDRQTTALPAGQRAIIDAVRAANPNTVVVLESSYPYSGDWDTGDVPALLWTSHAGQETGHALADVLFGDHNPSGRLTQTWYRSDADLPDILDYDIAKSGHTYQYFTGDPLYPFGHGLSYTSFRYGELRLSRSSVGADGQVEASVTVTNTGRRAGTEVVQLYTHATDSRTTQPLKKLAGFQRVQLEPGRSTTVRFRLAAADLAFWDVTRSRSVVEKGDYEVMVGSSAEAIASTRTLHVNGEVIPPRDLGRPTRAENFDDYQGTTLVDESKVSGTAVAAEAGSWIAFHDVNLGRGARTLTASLARAAAGSAGLTVRLDDPVRGRVVGRATVASTGDRYRYTTVTAALSGASGRHDVYLVFDAPATIATFRLTG